MSCERRFCIYPLRSLLESATVRSMQSPLSYRHRVITDDDLVFIRKLIADHPDSSRWALSKKLCEAWNWVQANGALRDMVCRGMMLKLHREGLIELPSVRPIPSGLGKRRRPLPVSVDETPVQVSLAELGPLEVLPKCGARPRKPCSTACWRSTTTWATRSRWVSI